MEQFIKTFLQNIFNLFGYHISQKEKGVNNVDAYSEQKRILKDTDVKVIFDVGAADGKDSIKYHNLFPNAIIYAFEPLPESYDTLVRNTKEFSRIVTLNFALSDSIGDAVFNITKLKDASSLLVPNETGSSFDRHTVQVDSINVKTSTIDEICHHYKVNHINILKMDVQGAEYLTLKGASNILSNKNLDLIYSEVNFLSIYKEMPLYHDIAMYLNKNSYDLFNLYNLIHNQNGQLAWGYDIFTKPNLK